MRSRPAARCQPSARRSTSPIVRQAVQRAPGTNASRDGRADRRGKQQGHPLGLALVAVADQALGVLRRTWTSVSRLAVASAAALAFWSASILRRLMPKRRIPRVGNRRGSYTPEGDTRLHRSERRYGPCVDGSELARRIFTSQGWSAQPCALLCRWRSRPQHQQLPHALQQNLASLTGNRLRSALDPHIDFAA